MNLYIFFAPISRCVALTRGGGGERHSCFPSIFGVAKNLATLKNRNNPGRGVTTAASASGGCLGIQKHARLGKEKSFFFCKFKDKIEFLKNTLQLVFLSLREDRKNLVSLRGVTERHSPSLFQSMISVEKIGVPWHSPDMTPACQKWIKTRCFQT